MGNYAAILFNYCNHMWMCARHMCCILCEAIFLCRFNNELWRSLYIVLKAKRMEATFWHLFAHKTTKNLLDSCRHRNEIINHLPTCRCAQAETQTVSSERTHADEPTIRQDVCGTYSAHTHTHTHSRGLLNVWTMAPFRVFYSSARFRRWMFSKIYFIILRLHKAHHIRHNLCAIVA